MLTKGLDNFSPSSTGTSQTTAGNDTIIGSIDNAVPPNAELQTLSNLDIVDGGAGTDTLKINVTGGATVALPNLSNVEIIEVSSASGATVSTAGVAGVTNLNVIKAAGAVAATADATTDVGVSVKGVAGTTVTVNGGKDVNVTTTDAAAAIDVGATGADPVGAVTITATSAAVANNANPTMGNIAVGGGKTVNVTQKVGDASAIVADGTTETVTQGNVVVTANATTTDVTVKQDAAATAASTAAVTGATEVASVKFTKLDAGESVTISGLTFTAATGKNLTADQVAQAFANLSASAIKPTQIAPPSTATSDTQGSGASANGTFTGALLADWTSGAATADTVVFTGKANTAMATDLVASAKATVTTTTQGVTAVTAQNTLGVANGTVTIAGAAALKTVTVDGYAASVGAADINGATNNALDTINLANGGNFGIDSAAATLGLTLANVNGTVEVTAGTKTLNAAVSHAKATETSTLVSASAETVNVTGTGNVAGNTTAGLTAATAINTSGMTAGKATFTVADGTKTSYTGGAGVDDVTVTNAGTKITKAIDLGAGNDTLTLSGTVVAPDVALKGGDGTDTIAMNGLSAESLSQNSTFAGKIEGFEKLYVNDTVAVARTVNMANMDGINYVISNGANGTGLGKQVETVTLSGNFVAGNTVAVQINALAPVTYTVVANDLTADGVGGGGAASAAQVLTNVAAKVATAIQGDVPSAAVVDAAVVAGTPGALTLTADVAGTAFTAAKTVVSAAGKQVETITLAGDYVVGDKVSVTVNALPAVEYTVVANDLTVNGDGTGGAATAAQIRTNVATKLAAAVQGNAAAAAVVDAASGGGAVTLTSDVAGTAFTATSSATSSATKQVETLTLTGDYAAGDTVAVTIDTLTPVSYTVLATDLTVNGDGTGGVASAAQIRANVAAKVVAAIQADANSAAVVDAAVVAGTPGALTLTADVAGTTFAASKAIVTTAAAQVNDVQLSGSYAVGDTVTVKVNNLTAVSYTVVANDLTADGVGGGGAASAAQVLTNVAAKVATAIQGDVPSAAVVTATPVAGTPGKLTLTAAVAGTPFAVTATETAGFGDVTATVSKPNSTGDGEATVAPTTLNKTAGAATAATTTPNKLVGDAAVASTTANDPNGSSLLTFDKMVNDSTVELFDAAGNNFGTASSAGVIVKMNDATGSTDSLNLVTKLSAANATFGRVDVAGVETLKLNAIDTILPPVGAVDTASLTLKADKATSLTIEGNSNVTLTLDATTTKLATIDAGTLTGSLRVDANEGAVAMTITGGLGADTLKASVGTFATADVINGGAGNDTIYAGSNGAKLTGGAGNDLFIVTASSALVGNKESNTYSEILDFQAGDVLQLQAFVGAATADATGFTKLAAVLNENTAQFSDFANAAVKEAGVGGSVWFNFKGDAYVVVDSDANTDAFVNGQDLVVKLTGINGDNLSWNSEFATVALV